MLTLIESFAVVELVAVVVVLLRLHTLYERDWCGADLLWPIVIVATPILVLNAAFYWKVTQTLAELLGTGVAIAGASLLTWFLTYYTDRFVGHVTGSALPFHSFVGQRINSRKMNMADRLVNDPNGYILLRQIITISTIDGGTRRKGTLKARLKNPPTKEQALYVIDAVGLSLVKSVLRGR